MSSTAAPRQSARRPRRGQRGDGRGRALPLPDRPVEILGADGKVTGIRVERMALGERDEKGRRKPVGTGEF